MKYSDLTPGENIYVNEPGENAVRGCKIDDSRLYINATTQFSDLNYGHSDRRMVAAFGDARYTNSNILDCTKDLNSPLITRLHKKVRNILVPQTFYCATPPGFIRIEGCQGKNVTAYAQMPALSMLKEGKGHPSEGAYDETLKILTKYFYSFSTRTAHSDHSLETYAPYSEGTIYACRRHTLWLILKIDGDFTVSRVNRVTSSPDKDFYEIISDPPKYFSFATFNNVANRNWLA